MFGKGKDRKLIHTEWEYFAQKILSEGYPITDKLLSHSTIKQFVSVCSHSMKLYALNNKLSKKTLRLLSVIKRLLADKRSFDAVKCIDYLVAGHNVSKSKMSDDIKTKVVAHFWQIINKYHVILQSERVVSNPMVPGDVLKNISIRKDCSH